MTVGELRQLLAEYPAELLVSYEGDAPNGAQPIQTVLRRPWTLQDSADLQSDWIDVEPPDLDLVVLL